MKTLYTLILSLLMIIPVYSYAGQGHEDPQQSKEERQKKRREQIMNAKIAFFTTELSLTPEEAQKFWPVYNQYWEDINTTHRKTRRLLYQLKQNIKSTKKVSSTEYETLLLEYIDSYHKEGEIYKSYHFELLKVLSPEKVARLYIAEEDFREQMINLLKEPNKPSQ